MGAPGVREEGEEPVAREAMMMSGAQIEAAMRDAATVAGQWTDFVQHDSGEDRSWRYVQMYLCDADGHWWSTVVQKHLSGDGRHRGLVFELLPVVRKVAMVERVTWVRELTSE